MQGFELGMSDFGQRMRSIVDSEVNKISYNAANQTTSAMTNNVTREIHRTNTVEKIARIEGDGITDELIRMLGLRLKAEERRTGVSFA